MSRATMTARAGNRRGRYYHPHGFSEPVKIRRAARDYDWCDHCELPIAKGDVHAVAYMAFAWHFHLGCVVECVECV